MKYKIKSWWIRTVRAIKWAIFIYKQPKWQEYESFLAIIEKRLVDMAEEFERTDITMSSAQDAKRMRLAAKLLKIYREEKYNNDYWESIESDFSRYNHKLGMAAEEKNLKALKLACKIIAQDLPGWWQ